MFGSSAHFKNSLKIFKVFLVNDFKIMNVKQKNLTSLLEFLKNRAPLLINPAEDILRTEMVFGKLETPIDCYSKVDFLQQ